MKRLMVAVLMVAGMVQAQMILLKGVDLPTITTGDLLDGTRNMGTTTNVVEIAGLMVSARSGETNQQINVTSSSLGINFDAAGDLTDVFESGKKLILSFSRDIRINQFDFNRLGAGESFAVAVDGMAPIEITYEGLTNKASGFFNTDLVVAANTEIEFYTTGASVVGLDGIDVTVLGVSLALSASNGSSSVSAMFNGPVGTNYVLQFRPDLTDSNGWETVSVPFATNASWQVETTNRAGFYRAIVE